MFIVIKKKWFFLAIVLVLIGFSWYIFQSRITTEAGGIPSTEDTLEIHMVTSEITSTTEDGKKIEAYRWDPGTIFVPKDKKVTLRMYGVNGAEHPFMIEGTDISGTVLKGKETLVDLHFTKEGVYRLICTAHAHVDHEGPMIAYIVVD
jgi:heme/copper-type cytochrome/quinol oxidase subunit 2